MKNQDTGQGFTYTEVEEYTYTHAPERIRKLPRVHEWSEEMMTTWPKIRDSVLQQVIQAARKKTDVKNGTYVAFMPDKGAHYYAKAEVNEHTGATAYHKQ